MDFTYAYLSASLLLLLIWFVLYVLCSRLRLKILLVSILTATLGLTEPLFVPAYWLPPTLFDLAKKTRFDLESLLFSFAVGGIAAVLYEILWRSKRKKVTAFEQHQKRHQIHNWALISPVISFFLLYLFTPLNPIYSSILAMIVGVLATFYCRPDLIKAMFIGSILFLSLYFVVFFVSFVWLFPGFVETVWNLPAISGILIVGVPIEELFFAATLGAMWSSVYEHFGWYKFA